MLHIDSAPITADRPRVKPILGRSIAAVICLGLSALTSIGLTVALTSRIVLLERVQAGVSVTREALLLSDAAVLWGSRLDLVNLLASAVAFLLWFHRAHANLPALGRDVLQYTPAKAVWSFFIPFANLAMPFFVMREIWQGSDPSIAPGSGVPYTTAGVSKLIHAWWGLFLARGVLGWLALLPIMPAPTVDTLLTSAQFLLASHSAAILDVGLAAVLIFRVQRRQETLAEQIQSAAA